ncbi:MAG TPA: prepilin-type N-terminal cleavage/methylation domain-containing protein [Gemmatimonadaceae bacterium]|nr:prepilin-type N-terminal cleavage/methylation domain-containing protein [Gemmatimonadaceae bacterium]
MRTFVRHGFTLVELLIVVVIIGILASIAIPKFSNTKEKAYAAAMRTDLRNLATAQESYFYSNDVYTTDPASLNFTTSPGVVITIPEATKGGWSGVATDPLAPAIKCALFLGGAAPVAPATVEGQITCG